MKCIHQKSAIPTYISLIVVGVLGAGCNSSAGRPAVRPSAIVSPTSSPGEPVCAIPADISQLVVQLPGPLDKTKSKPYDLTAKDDVPAWKSAGFKMGYEAHADSGADSYEVRLNLGSEHRGALVMQGLMSAVYASRPGFKSFEVSGIPEATGERFYLAESNLYLAAIDFAIDQLEVTTYVIATPAEPAAKTPTLEAFASSIAGGEYRSLKADCP